MCGEIEDDTGHDDAIFARFASLARQCGAATEPSDGERGIDLADARGRSAYMEGLFRDALGRALADAAAAPEGTRADAIAGQAIVFARLAGLLTAQLPPEADLFRSAMEAFMDGHAEPARRQPVQHHHHHHHHGHDHDHDH